ncbi:MAG TPA: cytochrome c oxidase assembly protein [Baekduia sp.]|nr:cytochrome c oxidase assembly protein [Baekduia sp.]
MSDVLVLAIAAAYAAAYLAGVRAVPARGHRPWPALRTASFLTGLAVAALALASPLAERADERLAAHMWQHLALTLLAAPLLVGGAPVALALQATAGTVHRSLVTLVRSRWVRVVTHPLVTWTAFAATMAVTHLTGWYDAALRDGPLHGLEHAAYLLSALLFWAPVVGANPLRQIRSWIGRTIYLVLAMVPMSTVAVMLVYAQHVRYPSYAAAARADGTSALLDQQAGGDIMWVAGSLAMVAATVGIGWQALVREERRQRALDAIEDAAGSPPAPGPTTGVTA